MLLARIFPEVTDGMAKKPEEVTPNNVENVLYEGASDVVRQEADDSGSEREWSDENESEKGGQDTPEDSEGTSNGEKYGAGKNVRLDLITQV